jgi:hypothetical protein
MMNPYGNKGWLDDYERDEYRGYLRSAHRYYGVSFDRWRQDKAIQVKAKNKRKTIQLRRTVLMHKILSNGYMAVNCSIGGA